MVKADVEHCEILQQAYLGGQAGSECVVHENDLIEVGHVAEAVGNAAVESVVGEDDDGDGGVAEVVRKVKDETVVVDENGVEIFVEQFPGHSSFEFVEPKIQELERRKAQDHLGEPPRKAVVTEIQLVEEYQLPERVGHSAAESVGVDVEECKIYEQTELLR